MHSGTLDVHQPDPVLSVGTQQNETDGEKSIRLMNNTDHCSSERFVHISAACQCSVC